MSTPVCQTVSANTDVLGKGTRINFHCTMFLLAIIPRTPITERLLNTLHITAGASSMGLLLTAIIQTAQHQLSLFHAIFILHILYSIGVWVSPIGTYHLTRSRIAMFVLVQFLSIISFVAWGLYLWVNVKDFGSQPECNDRIEYVIFFFFTVRATAPWLRRLWIAFFAIFGAQVLAGLVGTAAIFLFVKREKKREEEWSEGMDSDAGWVRTETRETRPLAVNEWYFHLDTSRLFHAIYATFVLERTVARNASHILPDGTNIGRGVVQVDDAWEFGQVLSVVMIIVNLKEVLHFLFDNLANAAHQAEGYSRLDSQPQTTTTYTRTRTSTTVYRWYSS
ncbi:hypothetical protein DFH94DRAFT_82722 [Russula ochroleuca]|uniref:Uncharacterized protein n=1 Tax=Russula ochroleuca TaxID=152965 RepID=A0A9P5MTD6_9AGAM|nr:hypothetical protein DFH94DRAFT_82722 [Russula ochroleuca]